MHLFQGFQWSTIVHREEFYINNRGGAIGSEVEQAHEGGLNERFDEAHDLVDEEGGVHDVDTLQATGMCILEERKLNLIIISVLFLLYTYLENRVVISSL